MIIAVILICSTNAYRLINPKIISKSKLNVMPLELKGQLNPSKSWPVKFLLNGVEKIIDVSEGTSLLEAGETIKEFDDVPSSCRNGVCTTCAAKIIEGRSNVLLAVHGLGTPLIDAGYVCSCQSFAVGPGVVIQLGAYDDAYEMQYGQYEKSYVKKN